MKEWTLLRKYVVILGVVGILGLLIAGMVAAQAPDRSAPGQEPVYGFKVIIDGVGDPMEGFTGFKSVSGMDSETEVIEFKQGNDRVVRKKPGQTTYSNLVITAEPGHRALGALSQWRDGVVNAGRGGDEVPDEQIDRRDGAVVLVDQRGRELARYNFSNAWPVKWELATDDDGMAIEKIEIAVEKVERAR